jgi:acyl-CoA reductase-like NAD-dependent aldehyde dehydrogenase
MSPSATSNHLSFTEFGNVIDGKVTKTEKIRTGINPSTGEPLYDHPVSTAKDIDDAVDAARRAFPSWSKTPMEKRKELLNAYADALANNAEGFAELLTKEQGKPLKFAKYEVAGTGGQIRNTTKLDLPIYVIRDTAENYTETRHTPLGVVCGIVPWNFPLSIAASKIAPGLMAGNCVILKPSPYTPYCGIKLVELGLSIFPPGVLQVVSGEDDIGPLLTAHTGIDGISFTGSIATGKKVMQSASHTLKKVTLELGGNDPTIILPDVDVAAVAPQIATKAFVNSSQICVAIKRIYVHEDIYPQFRDAFVAVAKSLKVGDGFTEENFMGPVQNKMQYERVKEIIADSANTGQKFLLGNEQVSSGKGYFINPTIIDNPPEKSRLVVEEPFGPIVPLLTWKDEEDVIARANDTVFGLGASVWRKDVDRATRIAKRLEAGNIWVNEHFFDHKAAFGGHKSSGLGVAQGVLGLTEFTNAQTIHIQRDTKL